MTIPYARSRSSRTTRCDGVASSRSRRIEAAARPRAMDAIISNSSKIVNFGVTNKYHTFLETSGPREFAEPFRYQKLPHLKGIKWQKRGKLGYF